MKKIAILTINDNNNYGNRLQNYALQEFIKKNCNLKIETIWNNIYKFKKRNKIRIKQIIKLLLRKTGSKRYFKFVKFTKNIKHSKIKIYNYKLTNIINNKYDYFITGSDQVWNPKFNRLSANDLLAFADKNKRISYAASFGISELPDQYKEIAKKELLKFKKISVREESGKKIVEELTGRKDVQILIDPTMLLTKEDWDKVSIRPKQLDKIKEDKYILNYFLGTLSDKRKKEIERIASENNCHIINILDKNDPFYETGPSEFLYLEKNAFLICTDSFHSSVFAIIYNTPFVVFDRIDSNTNMGTRIDTLLNKFKLENRKFNGKITEELLICDYKKTDEILKEEVKKSTMFLKKCIK